MKDGLQEVPLLTNKDEFEWLDLFEENKQKAQELQIQINQTDKEIDTMIYKLYGLTEDEIKIVENSLVRWAVLQRNAAIKNNLHSKSSHGLATNQSSF